MAEDLEAALIDAALPARHVAVALGHRAGTPTVLIAVEHGHPREAWRHAETAASVSRARLPDVSQVVTLLSRGEIPRTTNGKSRRRELW